MNSLANPRKRASHAVRNDTEILQAAGRLTANRGLDILSIAAVAKEAGLSARPVAARFEDATDIALELWRKVGRPALEPRLTRIWEMALSDEPTMYLDELDQILNQLARPDRDLVIMIELVAGCVQDSQLLAEVREDLHLWLDAALASAARPDPRNKAVLLYLLTMIFGLPMARFRPSAEQLNSRPVAEELLSAAAHLAEASELPDVAPIRKNDFSDVESDDPVSKMLLSAALREISEVGFKRSTTARIADRAGVSEGVIFNRFDSKADLLAHAIEHNRLRVTKAHWEFGQRMTEAYSRPIADAVAWREVLKPEFAPNRAYDIELHRASWHQPAMNAQMRLAEVKGEEEFCKGLRGEAKVKAKTDFHYGYAMGYAISLLALFFDDAWRQPFDSVMGGGKK